MEMFREDSFYLNEHSSTDTLLPVYTRMPSSSPYTRVDQSDSTYPPTPQAGSILTRYSRQQLERRLKRRWFPSFQHFIMGPQGKALQCWRFTDESDEGIYDRFGHLPYFSYKMNTRRNVILFALPLAQFLSALFWRFESLPNAFKFLLLGVDQSEFIKRYTFHMVGLYLIVLIPYSMVAFAVRGRRYVPGWVDATLYLATGTSAVRCLKEAPQTKDTWCFHLVIVLLSLLQLYTILYFNAFASRALSPLFRVQCALRWLTNKTPHVVHLIGDSASLAAGVPREPGPQDEHASTQQESRPAQVASSSRLPQPEREADNSEDDRKGKGKAITE